MCGVVCSERCVAARPVCTGSNMNIAVAMFFAEIFIRRFSSLELFRRAFADIFHSGCL